MITVSKSIKIMRKEKTSNFKEVNFKVLGDSGDKKIGGSVRAENAILANAEELKKYMPNILGVSPTAPEWGKALDNHVRSISAPIDPNGLDLQIGFHFDITDVDYIDAITKLAKTIKDAEVDGDLVESTVVKHIVNKVNRKSWWRYGRPIEAADYFLWRYIENYRRVANTVADADKSSEIRFYILDQDDVNKVKGEIAKIRRSVNKAVVEISSNDDNIRTLLFVVGKGDLVITSKDSEDLLMAMEDYASSNSARFLSVYENISKYRDNAFVEECIARGVLSRPQHSSSISDESTGEVLGSNTKDVVAMLRKDENAKLKNTLEGRVKDKTI